MNNCHLVGSIFCLIFVGLLITVNGFRWVSLKSGDTLPENIVFVPRSEDRYVGRARHFNEILPAEISADGPAFISSCYKEISKDQFEILVITTSDDCAWIPYDNNYENIEDTILRFGTARNGEPIYIGHSSRERNTNHIVSMYLNKNESYTWTNNKDDYYYSPSWQYLSCNVQNKWIDTSAKKLPNNSVSGGKSEDDYDIYVARLKSGCDIVTGQVMPDIGLATAFLNDYRTIDDSYCQVLVGELNEYTWVSASGGEIPDYAVAQGKNGREVSYVARFNKTIGHLTHSEALEQELDYEILVINQL